jgi:hypothetical protein
MQLENVNEALSPQKAKSLNGAGSFNPLVIERTDKSIPLISKHLVRKK